jgi:hypothetical protein
MKNKAPLRAALVGGANRPSGWALSNGAGVRTALSLEALLCLENKLRTDGQHDAANDLYHQVTTLARIAEAWRHRDHDLPEDVAP